MLLKANNFCDIRELAKEVVKLLMIVADGAKFLIDASDQLILYVEIAHLFGTLGYQRKAAFFSGQVAQLYLQQEDCLSAKSLSNPKIITSDNTNPTITGNVKAVNGTSFSEKIDNTPTVKSLPTSNSSLKSSSAKNPKLDVTDRMISSYKKHVGGVYLLDKSIGDASKSERIRSLSSSTFDDHQSCKNSEFSVPSMSSSNVNSEIEGTLPNSSNGLKTSVRKVVQQFKVSKLGKVVQQHVSQVIVAGHTFGSPKFFRTLKEAKLLAAKVALSSLSIDDMQENDSALYKNLLQKLIVKEEGEVFLGVAANTKKQAEINATKVKPYLKECRSNRIEASVFQSDKDGDQEINSARTSSFPIKQASTSKPKMKGAPSLHGMIYANSGNQFPMKGELLSLTSATTEYSDSLSTNINDEQTEAMTSYLCNTVRVFLRKPDMTFPDGVTVLPVSDGNTILGFPTNTMFFSAPPLKLIDLPGLDLRTMDDALCTIYASRAALRKDQNNPFYDIAENIEISDYVEHNDVILLVTIPASHVPEISSSRALKLAKEYDAEGTRTVGVISKKDKVASDQKIIAAVQALLLNQ
ncbi:hypothetical protein GIB67_013960, partial [Kingdonia uniflora]